MDTSKVLLQISTLRATIRILERECSELEREVVKAAPEPPPRKGLSTEEIAEMLAKRRKVKFKDVNPNNFSQKLKT